jgi:hypothetical protein
VRENICRENARVVAKRNGIITKLTSVRRTLMCTMTWSALANAKMTLTTLRMPKPSRSLTCWRSPVERLMISPDDIVR